MPSIRTLGKGEFQTNNTNDRKIAAVVDCSTGEITDYIYTGDSIIHKPNEQREYEEQFIRSFNRREAFVKVYTTPLFDLYKELTRNEKVIVLGILPLISYSDGVLRFNNQLLDLKEMSELLGENYRSFREGMGKLIEKGVIAKTDVVSDKSVYHTKQCYVVNPFIFFKGTDLEKRFGNLFRDTTWNPNKDIKQI